MEIRVFQLYLTWMISALPSMLIMTLIIDGLIGNNNMTIIMDCIHFKLLNLGGGGDILGLIPKNQASKKEWLH